MALGGIQLASLPACPRCPSLGGLCHQRSPREHETSMCPALLEPEQPPGQVGTDGGSLLLAPWHTPAAAGYLAVSTQASSCGRLGTKAGLPPGIVLRPQLGRISWDSSAEGEEMGRGSLPCGGPWPGGAPTHWQGGSAPLSPTGESSGCPRTGVMGCGDTVGHRTPGWHCVAQAGLAGRGCQSSCVPYPHRHGMLQRGLCHAKA